MSDFRGLGSSIEKIPEFRYYFTEFLIREFADKARGTQKASKYLIKLNLTQQSNFSIWERVELEYF